MKLNTSLIFKLYYLLLAIISGFFITVLPLFYIELGFNNTQISILTSLIFLSTFVQIALNKYIHNIKTWFVMAWVVILVTLFALDKTTNYYLVTTLIFASTAFRILIVTLLDDYSLKFCDDIGKVRKYATLGFGATGLVFGAITLIMQPYYFLIITATILLVLSLLLPTYKREAKKVKLKHVSNKQLILFNAFFMGIVGLKLTYQSIYLDDLSLIGLFMLITVLVEMVIMHYYTELKTKFQINWNTFALIGFTISVLILVISTSPAAIALSAIIQGIAMGMYLPNYFTNLVKGVDDTISTILFSSVVQCLIGFAISLAIITPLYAIFNINVVFSFFVIAPIILLISQKFYFKLR